MLERKTLTSQTIDFLRFPCAVLVVFIHSMDGPFSSSDMAEIGGHISCHTGVYDMIRILMSKGVCLVAVPIFFFISGYLFFSKMENSWDWKIWWVKIKKRTRTLLAPYMIWNALMLFFLTGTFLLRFIVTGKDFQTFWGILSNYGGWLIFWNCDRYGCDIFTNVLGWKMFSNAMPLNWPLWFLRDLMVVIIFSPLIFFIIRQLKQYGIYLMYVLYIFQIWIPYEGFSAVSWFYFSLGAYLYLNRKDIIITIERYGVISILCSIIILFFCVFTYGVNVSLYNYMARVFTLPAVVASFYCISKGLEYDRIHVNGFLSDCSFFLYVTHAFGMKILVAYILSKLLPNTGDFYLIIAYFLYPLFTVACLCVLYHFLKLFLPRITAICVGGRI